MDDLRDIGAADFVRFEKIRARLSNIVEDFNLVTNNTPGVLQIDPVLVVYDLAQATAAPPDLAVEGDTFVRAIESTRAGGNVSQVVFSGASGEHEFPFSAEESVTRPLAIELEIANPNSVTMLIDFWIKERLGGITTVPSCRIGGIRIDGATTDNVIFAQSVGETQIIEGEDFEQLANAAGSAFDSNNPTLREHMPFVGLTIGKDFSIVMEFTNQGGAGNVPVDYSVYYEERT